MNKIALETIKWIQYIIGIFGLEPNRKSEDRLILKNIILPAFSDKQIYERILFVGCAQYTKSYDKFFVDQDYWTLDYNPHRAKYGSKNHIIGNVLNLSSHFKEDYFDVIIFNGIFGWGINNKNDCIKTIKELKLILSKKGVLIVGWNNQKPFNLVSFKPILYNNDFKNYFFKPLENIEYTTNMMSHTYSFFSLKK